jgi:hypothetical protein
MQRQSQVPEGKVLNFIGKSEEMSQTDKQMDWR